MRLAAWAWAGAALLSVLCGCDVSDEAAGKRGSVSPEIDGAPTAPVTTSSPEDGGAAAPADAAYDGPYPDVTPARVEYVLTADTVLDRTNKLMWQRNEPGQFFELVPTDYCASLALDGFNDWRPATVAELKTILVLQPNCPLLDLDAFPNALCDWYISSDTVNSDIYMPQMVDFATGVTKNISDVGLFQAYSTRCVRTSQ